MSIVLILQAIMAVLKFPGEMAAFLRLIEKTPEEKRADIAKQIQAMEAEFEETGRPPV